MRNIYMVCKEKSSVQKNISEHLVEGKYLTIIAQPSCIPNNIYTSQNIYKTIFP